MTLTRELPQAGKPRTQGVLTIGEHMVMRLSLAVAAVAALVSGAASAQDYPTRNIIVVVPFAAGGPTDTIARMTALGMSKALNQQVLVENVVGAGGTIANAKVAAANPDGYTLLV